MKDYLCPLVLMTSLRCLMISCMFVTYNGRRQESCVHRRVKSGPAKMDEGRKGEAKTWILLISLNFYWASEASGWVYDDLM